MKTLVIMSVLCIFVVLKTDAEDGSSDQYGNLVRSPVLLHTVLVPPQPILFYYYLVRRSSEVQQTKKSEKKLFQDIPIPASFLSHSFRYKCRKKYVYRRGRCVPRFLG